ncbi:MAG: hypothetical protein ABI874_05750 [Chloroflexota bacterium]
MIVIASGQDSATVPMLAALAERFALPVLEHRARFVCLPSDHPLHLGYDWLPAASEADVILVLESDVPWIPMLEQPKRAVKVIQVGVDPLFRRYPMRSFPADLSITSSARAFLPALHEALSKRSSMQTERIASRRARIASWQREVQARWAEERTRDEQSGGAITKVYLNRCLDALKPDDAIVINEYWAMRQHLCFTQAGTYFQYPAVGALG